jgi:hypothetical protein
MNKYHKCISILLATSSTWLIHTLLTLLTAHHTFTTASWHKKHSFFVIHFNHNFTSIFLCSRGASVLRLSFLHMLFLLFLFAFCLQASGDSRMGY